MSDTTYSDWTNYQTWCVAMWLGSDAGLYEESRGLAGEARGEASEADAFAAGIWTREQSERFTLAEWLRTWVVENLAPDLGASFPADLLTYALCEVNWDEIAADILSETATA